MTKNISLNDYPLLLKKMTKDDLHQYFTDLLLSGSLYDIDTFVNLPFPEGKQTGIFVFDQKTKCTNIYENYLYVILLNNRTDVFDYFCKGRDVYIGNCLGNCCVNNNAQMAQYLIENYDTSSTTIETNLNWCVEFNQLELFRYLTSIKSLDLHYNNNELLKKSLVEDKTQFTEILIIDCDLKLDEDIVRWLKGDNEYGEIYTLPFELIEKKKLHTKLNQSLQQSKNPITANKTTKI